MSAISQSVTQEQQSILCHTLGITPERREPYRNHFVAGPGHYAMDDINAMAAAGLMKKVKSPAFLPEGDETFVVTDDGKQVALSLLPPQSPQKTPSRYAEYLSDDTGDTFANHLGIYLPEIEYRHNGTCRMIRRRRWYDDTEIAGEWFPTKKAAKASYKEALKAHRAALKAE